MEEITFLKERDAEVTTARFITPYTTYAMSGITSVKRLVEMRKLKPGFVVIFIGVVVFVTASTIGMKLLAAAIVIGGAVALFLAKDTYFVVVHSASGETKAIESKDEAYIDRVIEALNRAIIARG